VTTLIATSPRSKLTAAGSSGSPSTYQTVRRIAIGAELRRLDLPSPGGRQLRAADTRRDPSLQQAIGAETAGTQRTKPTVW